MGTPQDEVGPCAEYADQVNNSTYWGSWKVYLIAENAASQNLARATQSPTAARAFFSKVELAGMWRQS